MLRQQRRTTADKGFLHWRTIARSYGHSGLYARNSTNDKTGAGVCSNKGVFAPLYQVQKQALRYQPARTQLTPERALKRLPQRLPLGSALTCTAEPILKTCQNTYVPTRHSLCYELVPRINGGGNKLFCSFLFMFSLFSCLTMSLTCRWLPNAQPRKHHIGNCGPPNSTLGAAL